MRTLIRLWMDTIKDLLLDTHIVMWMAVEPKRIPTRWRTSIEAAERCFVSHVTAFEIQLKALKSSPHFGFSLHHLEQTMKAFSLKELPIGYDDIKKMDEMTFMHRDPFDRLLMAQSANRSRLFVTTDKDILLTAKQFKQFQVLK